MNVLHLLVAVLHLFVVVLGLFVVVLHLFDIVLSLYLAVLYLLIWLSCDFTSPYSCFSFICGLVVFS